MKPSSPLSSFSSPSSCNVHETLSISKNGRASSGCIARVLRRILCFSSLPSCPFDYFKEDEEKKDGLLLGRPDNPGIVARLMGLESLPGPDRIDRSPSAYSSRKRRSSQVRRRQIIPTSYQELEDENFFILSFEHGDADRHEFSRRKSRASSDGMKKKKSMRRRGSGQEQDKENEGVNVLPKEKLDSDSNIRSGSDFQAENTRNVLRPLENSCQKSDILTRKKRAKEDYGLGPISFVTEGDSENSSPNSVLEFVDYPTDIQETACSGNISRLANSKMRRTLCEELENCGKSNEKKLMNSGCVELIRIWRRHPEKWDEVGKLAAMEMVESSWVHDEIRKNKHYYKEIGRDFASQILHHLLDELLSDLA
ncbi:hypothetical protein Salat_2893100 [Sesamum alatum]|uniref:DUF3741 domain-containing protein n=1 Tax=Sesamum alatum TaxID=300844 RepID=A0AAE2C8C4_9LAMI|nr:hypothetical protein Salat_2893100 [Sesamum alatum]